MKKLIPLLILAMISLSGCVIPKSYIDPKFQNATYADIKPANPLQQVALTVEAQTNGKPNKAAADFWRKQFEEVLVKSAVFGVTPGAKATLSISIDNYSVTPGAAGKGFVTGLTFGAVGTAVTDGYKMIVTFNNGNGQVVTKTYQHALHTVVGNAEPPAGMAPIKLSEAAALIARDLLLNFLKDYQAGAK